MIFKRNCPKCNCDIFYKNKTTYNYANNNKSVCKTCSRDSLRKIKNNNITFIKNCPICNKIITYKGEGSLKRAIKNNTKCQSCANRELHTRPDVKKKLNISLSGKNNPMYKKSFYSVWVEKYGEEKAKELELNRIEKLKFSHKGEKNHMFGKPSPKRSGNGWSGNYDGNYFRSLLELCYLIYLVDNDIKFESGEKRKHSIKYIFDGIERNYFPDYYLIDEDKYIEIKPKSLVNSKQNKLKFESARKKLNNRFIILTEDNVYKDVFKIYKLYNENRIIFDKGYDFKFKNYINKELNL